jgi:hypothetical protein
MNKRLDRFLVFLLNNIFTIFIVIGPILCYKLCVDVIDKDSVTGKAVPESTQAFDDNDVWSMLQVSFPSLISVFLLGISGF